MGRRRRARTGTEPVTAFSDLRLRLILSLIFVPAFVIGALLLTVWWANAEPGGGVDRGAIGVAALICGIAAVIAIVDLVVIVRRLRRGRRPPGGRGAPPGEWPGGL